MAEVQTIVTLPHLWLTILGRVSRQDALDIARERIEKDLRDAQHRLEILAAGDVPVRAWRGNVELPMKDEHDEPLTQSSTRPWARRRTQPPAGDYRRPVRGRRGPHRTEEAQP